MSYDCHKLPEGMLSPPLLSGLSPTSPILVAYSGGADSTALLHMLCRWGKDVGCQIYAAHVNHGIRGEEADRDEAFCRRTADALGIPLFVHRADVSALSKERGESVETTARDVRYEFFDRIMAEHEIPLLATAHNADDNLETMLFHLVRGSSLRGICGIPVTRLCENGVLVRPLLPVTRKEILAYCESHKLCFVTDSTNTDTDYTRNRIRSDILPLLKELNPSCVEHAAQLAEALRADHLCLESMANLFAEEMRVGDGFELEKINGSPDAVVNRALISLYRDVSGGGALENSHVIALRRLASKAVPHSRVTLPRGIVASVEEDRLVFARPVDMKEIEPYSVSLSMGRNVISQTMCEIIMESSQNTKNIYKNSILLSLDSATINGTVFAESRKAGDRIRLGGMHKSLKKLYTEKKIPLSLRSRLPVLRDADGILAVPLVGQRDGTRPKKDSGEVCYIRVLLM